MTTQGGPERGDLRQPEREVGEKRGAEPEQRGLRPEEREGDENQSSEKAGRHTRVVVLVDPCVEGGEGGRRVQSQRLGAERAVLAESCRGDIRDRNEPGDSGRIGQEDAAVARRDDHDRIAPVVRLGSALRQGDEDVRRLGRSGELVDVDQRRLFGQVAAQRIAHLTLNERGERLLAAGIGPGARHQQSVCALRARQRRLDDVDRELLRGACIAGQDSEEDERKCRGAGHGRTLGAPDAETPSVHFSPCNARPMDGTRACLRGCS